MDTIKEKQLALLNETVEYYSADPVGRRCVGERRCAYSPIKLGLEDTSEGCAIGRKITAELAEEFDAEIGDSSVSNRYIFDRLPEELKELTVQFLEVIQYLHDSDNSWDGKGLTQIGKERVEQIKRDFKLC